MADTFYNLFKELEEITGQSGFNIKDFEPEIPIEVKTFLGQLSLLQNVPFTYLVADEKYLPKFKKPDKGNDHEELEECGSLRFFWLDPMWVQCLLNGAVSLFPDDMELLLTKAMAGDYAAHVYKLEMIDRIKKQLYGSYNPNEIEQEIIGRLKENGLNIERLSDPAKATNAQANWRYTGFFLRSSLVSGWKGLEVVTKGIDNLDEKTPARKLNIVRMETIAPDTFFCLCEGIITEVTISQPPEGLHFGVDGVDNTGKYYKQKSNSDKRIEVPLRGNGKRKGVLNIDDNNGLVRLMKEESTKFTSAEFAVSLVAKAIKNTVTVVWNKK
jgi:hypothetical protein